MFTFKEVTKAVSSASDVSEILPFIIYIVTAKKPAAYRILGAFFFISGTIKVMTYYLAERWYNTLPEYHLLAFLEAAFLYAFYRKLSGHKIHPWFIVVLFIICLANAFYQPITTVFNSNTWTLSALLVMILGLNYFYLVYKNDETSQSPMERPDFIITAAWLLYASGAFFTYLMSSEILSGEANSFFNNAWIFQCIPNIIKNLTIGYGFWLTSKKWRKLAI